MGQYYNLIFADLELSCEIIKSNRKTAAIQVTAEGLVRIRIPSRTTKLELHNIIEQNKDWIYSHYEKSRKQQEYAKKQIFCNGTILQFHETCLQVEVVPSPVNEKTMIQIVGSRLQIMTSELSDQDIHACVVLWLRKVGRTIFQERVQHFAALMQVEYQNITIKDQKTRWGSCSSKKNLNFNYRLLLMPASLLDYVVVHELAHLKEMNHSKKFWGIVEAVLPDYKQQRKRLMEYRLA